MKRLLVACVVIVLGVWACREAFDEIVGPAIDDGPGFISLTLVADLGDSLDIEVAFDTTPDPSGIQQIDWENWGTSPVQDTIAGSTPTLLDTLRVRKPALNTTDGYAMHARAVDNVGNAGSWSADHPWAVVYSDTAGPNAPGILLDTVRISPSVAVLDVKVWPLDATVQVGKSVQLYAAVLESDGRVLCTDATNTASEGPWTNAAACDSAVAMLDFSLLPALNLRYAAR